MGGWAAFNQGDNTILFNLTGKAIPEGYFEGTVKLSDPTNFTSYTLYVEVIENRPLNTQPFFKGFRTEALILQIGQEEPVVY